MTMRIVLYSNFRSLLGKTALELVPPPATFRQALNGLLQSYPQLKPYLLDTSGEFRGDVGLFVDGRNPRLADNWLEAPLPSEAEISLFSPIASGRMNVENLRGSATRSKDQKP